MPGGVTEPLGKVDKLIEREREGEGETAEAKRVELNTEKAELKKTWTLPQVGKVEAGGSCHVRGCL